ncbi:hypothetical protein C8R45DRAFT_1037579 [Mycena sanguinolenta]|nr:hypothetical protein C8R45DRAFT_1037579 [Mycena sanguinolenta]
MRFRQSVLFWWFVVSRHAIRAHPGQYARHSPRPPNVASATENTPSFTVLCERCRVIFLAKFIRNPVPTFDDPRDSGSC